MVWLLLLKLSSAAVSIGLGAGILARDHGLKANRLIAGFLFCNAWWATGEFFLYQQTDPEAAATILRLMTIGWVPLGVFCMHASVTLSSMDDHPITRMLPTLYVAIAFIVPIAMFSDFVIAGAAAADIGWRPIFNPGMVLTYGVMVTPVVSILACWRGVIALPENGGQLLLARIVFFGISGALITGTMTAVILPLFGIAAVGLTTTLLALVGVAVALTLRRFGHSLISPQALAREILDTLEDGVVLVSEGGILRDANRAFLRMLEVRELHAVGRPITDWIPEFQERRGSSEMSTFMEVRAREGESIPVVVSAPVALHGAGGLVGQAFLVRDRREIVSLQRRLAVSARLAAVGDLSKSISRSINDPVARTQKELEGLASDWRAMEQILELAELDGPCGEAVEEGFELIEECVEGVDRIFSIVHEIIGFSSECPRESFAQHPLDQIVSRGLRVAKVQAPAWLDIEERLDPDVWIDCNSSEIERVVTNLLLNAIQAIEESSREDAHLVIAVASKGGRALLHVEDDGCGIEPEVLDRVFDPFFTTKPVGKGTGLGLAISYHIVKDHGGDIRVSSIRGRGTSVTVELPRAMTGVGTDGSRISSGENTEPSPE
jgi:signal transduction histidine kinase